MQSAMGLAVEDCALLAALLTLCHTLCISTQLLVQVSSLIQLYVDMEHTGRNAAFYEKFSTRHMIGQILREPPSFLHAPRLQPTITEPHTLQVLMWQHTICSWSRICMPVVTYASCAAH